jgi:Domain of unknown function (DUF5919)
MAGGSWLVVSRLLSRRVRHLVAIGVLGIGAIVLLTEARFVNGYWQGLCLNLGASLVMVIATFLIFNPIFAEIRAVTSQEHPRLDYDAFIEHVRRTHGTVCILETWTGALEEPYRRRFLEAVQQALQRGARVRILLLDPDAAATEQRTEEIHRRRDVRQEIMTNLLDLRRLWSMLDESVRRRLEVRIYSASPSVQLYRWDDKAYLSFFPLGALAYDTPQLETFMNTPWGEFVDRRFDELWEDTGTRDLAAYWSTTLTLVHPDGRVEDCQADYVVEEEVWYLSIPDLAHHLDQHGLTDLGVRRDGDGVAYRLEAIADEELRTRMTELLRSKYGGDRAIPVRLVAVPG